MDVLLIASLKGDDSFSEPRDYFKRAKQALMTAQNDYKCQAVNAFKYWLADPITGASTGTTFRRWVIDHGLSLVEAQEARDFYAGNFAHLA